MERSKKSNIIIDMRKVEKNILLLEEGKRFKEMVVYLFQVFKDHVISDLGIEHPKSQTYREFSMDLVKKVRLDVNLIYPFVSLFEEIRYSSHPINKGMYTEARKLFDKLVKYIKTIPKGKK